MLLMTEVEYDTYRIFSLKRRASNKRWVELTTGSLESSLK